DADDAALGHVHHVNVDVRHVLDAAELVELHVGIYLPAGVAVVDRFLVEGVVDAHDDAAGDLRFAAELVDDQSAILDGPEARAADDAGLGIDLDLGDLNAAHAVIAQARAPLLAEGGIAGKLLGGRPIGIGL